MEQKSFVNMVFLKRKKLLISFWLPVGCFLVFVKENFFQASIYHPEELFYDNFFSWRQNDFGRNILTLKTILSDFWCFRFCKGWECGVVVKLYSECQEEQWKQTHIFLKRRIYSFLFALDFAQKNATCCKNQNWTRGAQNTCSVIKAACYCRKDHFLRKIFFVKRRI